jgi:hypothetical protein
MMWAFCIVLGGLFVLPGLLTWLSMLVAGYLSPRVRIRVGYIALLAVVALVIAAVYWRGAIALFALMYGTALLMVGAIFVQTGKEEMRRPTVGLRDVPP